MPQILRGTTEPLEQRFTEEFSPTNGLTRALTWKSFDRQKIQLFADRYAALRCGYHLDVEHGIATLVATDNSGNFTLDVWEVGVSDILVSSLKNPLNIAAIGDDNRDVIARSVKDGLTLPEAAEALAQEGLEEFDTFGDPFQFAGPPAEVAAAQRLFLRLKSDSDSFFYSQYSLRHTTNVSNGYAINISDEGVNQIYTPAKLISEVTNANQWTFPMPPRLVFKLLAVPVPPITPNYLWGWLKSASPENTAPYDRVNIVTEYKLFLWSTDEYVPF